LQRLIKAITNENCLKTLSTKRKHITEVESTPVFVILTFQATASQKEETLKAPSTFIVCALQKLTMFFNSYTISYHAHKMNQFEQYLATY